MAQNTQQRHIGKRTLNFIYLDKSVKDYLEFYSLLVPSNTDLYEGVSVKYQ